MKSSLFSFIVGLLFFVGIVIGDSYGIPRPEHPLPQVQRAEWLNLNGEWNYAETNDNDAQFMKKEAFPETILVPFCRESKASGIGRTGFIKNAWYHREFTVPSDWTSPRIRLHIGACDWITTVWINGKLVGRNQGGYSGFAFDITPHLSSGNNSIIIHAFDDVQSGLQPLGKQSRRERSSGIFYTRTTGIWQTVWLEGVGRSFIRDFEILPDPDNARIILQTEIDGQCAGYTIEASAYAGSKQVAKVEQTASWRNNHIVLPLSETHLWSVENPYLYNLKIVLKDGGTMIDAIDSYFGLRKVSIEGGAILINNKPVFQRTVLDQGFYPDGIWTAPTDADLRGDIELAKSVGFNGARLHQKVFEPRFLYWADKLGYLVWGEFPSYGADYDNPEVNRPWVDEWVNIVRRDRNHPSIIGWCPFNETPGSAGELQNTIWELTQAIDPSRPVIDTSGWTHSYPDPEVMDAHDYNQNPNTFKQKWMNYFLVSELPSRYANTTKKGIPFFVSEFGGIGWFKEQDNSWGYGNNPKTLEEFYTRFEGLIGAQLDNPNLFGYCYTQLTDIEQEKNGIFNYDRTPKFDAQRLHAIQTRVAAYETHPPLTPAVAEQPDYRVLLGAAQDGQAQNSWQYTVTPPEGNSWLTSSYDASNWKTGKPGFGSESTPEKWIATTWNTKDIWLRRNFTYDGSPFSKAMLVTHYDNETHVFVNGKLVWNKDGWNDNYEGFDITKALQAALQEGDNTIAVHCHQDDGGQYIDVGILIAQ